MQRDVNVRLSLNASPFIAGTKAAQAATTKLGADITKTAAAGSRSAGVLGSSFGTVGIVAGLAGAKLVSAAATFEQGMSSVKATGADAVKNIGALREAALKAGAATKYSATEAAGGVEALAKAGVSSADVLGGGLKGALNLAAAGNLDVAGSAEAAASAMNQFGLAGADVPHIADLLAAGAGKAQGEVSDMAQALNQAGLIAHGAGASIEETTGTLAAFASAGLVGSDAGTSFKTMLQRLQHPVGDAALLMKKYNISLYDAEGHYAGLDTVAGQLRDNMANLTEEQRATALAVIFGSDAVRAANVLYEQGEGGIKKWTAAVDDAGFAAEVAKTKMDNLAGDWENFKGSVETLAIGGGSGSQSTLRTSVQDATDLANALGQVSGATPDWLKSTLLRGAIPQTVDRFKDLFNNGRATGIGKQAGVSATVVTKFQTIGADGSIRKAMAVARAAGLTPREVRSVLRLLGWSTKKIDAVTDSLVETRRVSQVRASMRTFGFGTKEIDAVVDALKTAQTRSQLKVSLSKKGFDTSEIDAILVLLKNLGAIKPEPKVKAKDEASLTIKGINNLLLGLHDKTVTVTTRKQTVVLPAGGGALEGGTLHGYSQGGRAVGAISGAGTGTSDSIPAMLSNGEHVLTASDVAKAGGQDAIFRLRAGIQSGLLGFASGGPVGMTSNQWALAIAQLQADMADNRSQLKTTKGSAARRLLNLEYKEDQSSLRRLRGGLSADYDFGLSSIADARNAPVSLFGGLSDSPWMRNGGFGSQATQKLTQIKTLAGKLVELRKRGLAGGLIAEIAELGSGQGIAAADALLKSPGEIKQLTRAYAGIQGYNGVIAAAAYQPPYAGGGVRIAVESFKYDDKSHKASMVVIARDEAGKVLDKQSIHSAVNS